MLDVAVSNFQSWSSASFQVEGLTVIVGPSNRGKSALIRAVRGVLRNEVASEYVKIGSKGGAKVSVSVNGVAISASRTEKGSTTYLIGEESFAKLGGAAPPPLATMGFNPIDVNGAKLDPIFAGQFDSQFLVASSPAELNAVLNAFASTEKLDRGRKVLSSRTGEINAQVKVLSPQISDMELLLGSLDVSVSAAAVAMDHVNAQHASVVQLERAGTFTASYASSRIESDKVAEGLRAIDATKVVLDDSLWIHKLLVRLSRTQMARETIRSIQGHLGAIEDTSALAKSVEVRARAWRSVRDLATATLQVAQATVGQKAVDAALAKLTVPINVSRAATGINAFCSAQTSRTRAADRVKSLAAVEPILTKALLDYKGLVRLKAVMAADPTALVAKAEAIPDTLPVTTHASSLVRALTVLESLKNLALASEATVATMGIIRSDIQSAENEQSRVSEELEVLRKSGEVVTCPKCHSEFPVQQHVHA